MCGRIISSLTSLEENKCGNYELKYICALKSNMDFTASIFINSQSLGKFVRTHISRKCRNIVKILFMPSGEVFFFTARIFTKLTNIQQRYVYILRTKFNTNRSKIMGRRCRNSVTPLSKYGYH